MNTALPSGRDRYARTVDFERKTSELRLRPIEWDIVLAVDVAKTLSQVAQECSASEQDVAAILARFESLGLVETPRLSLEEYRALHQPAPVEVPPPPEASVTAPRITFSLKRAAPATLD